MRLTLLKNIITFVALGLIVLHILKPGIAIDSITLGLLVIAIIPWLTPLFKSLQFPGGVKIEYQDLENSEKQMKKAGLFSKKKDIKSQKFDFVPSPDDDPTLALAWLRIEIEKRLRELAKMNKLPEDRGITMNLFSLHERRIFNEEEKNALFDLIKILGNAIHGVSIDQDATEWAIEVGPLLLKGLDYKLKKK